MRTPWSMPDGCTPISHIVFIGGLSPLSAPTKATLPPIPGLLLPPLLVEPPPDIPCLPFTLQASGAVSFAKDATPHFNIRFERKDEDDSPCGFDLKMNLSLPYMPAVCSVDCAAAYYGGNVPTFSEQSLGLNNLGVLKLHLKLLVPDAVSCPSCPSCGPANIDAAMQNVACGMDFALHKDTIGDLQRIVLEIPPWRPEVTHNFSEGQWHAFSLYRSCISFADMLAPAEHRGAIMVELRQPHNVYDLRVSGANGFTYNDGLSQFRWQITHDPATPDVRYNHILKVELPWFAKPFQGTVNYVAGTNPKLSLNPMPGTVHVPNKLVLQWPSTFDGSYSPIVSVALEAGGLKFYKSKLILKKGCVFSIVTNAGVDTIGITVCPT